MVQILITCDKAQNLQLTDTSYLLLTVERYPIYIKQSVVSSIFKCSSTGEQQKNFQTSAALQENNKSIFRQFQQQSALCKEYDIYNLYKYFMVHDNKFCQLSLFTASFPENFQLYSALWCVIWGHGDNTTSDPSQILPTCLLLILKKSRQSLLLDSTSSLISQWGIHVMHTTRPEPTLSKLTKLHTWKHAHKSNKVFETRKTRLQSHTMGINPINIKKVRTLFKFELASNNK
jgi:hypothetical protein